MITVRLNGHEHTVPNRWDDFRSRHSHLFLDMCGYLEAFETGEADFNLVRLGIAGAMVGLDVRYVSVTSSLAENLLRLADYMDFPFSFTDNEDGSRSARVRICLKENLFPSFPGRKGYRFRVTDDGMVDTDLTAAQYVDILELMDLYTSCRKDEVLDRLFDSVYSGKRNVRRCRKVAVYYNLRGILEWIRMIPDFRILFSSGKARSQTRSVPLGASGAIFSLSKAGYGTLGEMKNLEVFDYLAALVQLNVDGILSLRSAGLKPADIAEKMNLPLEEVLPYITANSEE